MGSDSLDEVTWGFLCSSVVFSVMPMVCFALWCPSCAVSQCGQAAVRTRFSWMRMLFARCWYSTTQIWRQLGVAGDVVLTATCEPAWSHSRRLWMAGCV